MSSNIDKLIANINQWGIDRGLFPENGATGFTQIDKLNEEIEEYLVAKQLHDREGIIDAIGDCLVVLIQIARIEGIKVEEALNAAWNEIKDRKGKLINGVFVKEL